MLFFSADLIAQVRPRPKDRKANSLIEQRRTESEAQSGEFQSLVRRIEKELAEGDVSGFAADFSEQVTMHVGGGETGTYSTAQASALLQNYFSFRKPISFAFSRTNATPPILFATGRLTFVYKGSQESVQVYVSFARQNGRWAIVQFNLY